MKKILTLLTVFCGIIYISNGQEISPDIAKDLLTKTAKYARTSDSVSFASLWYLDNTPAAYDNKVFTRQQVMEEYHTLKSFIDAADKEKLVFDSIEISKMSRVFKAKYKIKAWSAVHGQPYKAYGFLVDFIDNRWVIRFRGEQTFIE